MTTPEIQNLIQPLEQYMTPDQKAELEKILSIGKKWKEEGEKKKQEFRESNDRQKFTQQILNYPKNKKKRESENGIFDSSLKIRPFLQKISSNILKEIGYDKMKLIEKKKFEEEFIEDLILYSDYNKLPSKKIKSITLEEFKQKGLKEGSELNLRGNKIGDDGALAIAQALEKTGGLKEGTILFLNWNQIGDEGAVAIIEAIAKTGGLKIGSELNLGDNQIGDEGAIAIAESLAKTGGLKAGSILHLGNNKIGDIGLAVINQAIEKTGGLKAGSKLNLKLNKI